MGTDERCMAWIQRRDRPLRRPAAGARRHSAGRDRRHRLRSRRGDRGRAPPYCGLDAQGRPGRGAGFRLGRPTCGAVPRGEGRRAGRGQRHQRDAARPGRASMSRALARSSWRAGRSATIRRGEKLDARRHHRRRLRHLDSGGAAGRDACRTMSRACKTRLVAQGANIPCTAEAEAMLHARGMLVLPDFIANAGGVICAATEYHGGTEAAAFAAIAEKIGRNTSQCWNRHRKRAACRALPPSRWPNNGSRKRPATGAGDGLDQQVT